MPTSTGGLKSSIEDGIHRYTVLPPIPTGPLQNGASEVPPQRLARQRKLLRHRRIKDYQQELQKIMMDNAMEAYRQASDNPCCDPEPVDIPMTSSKQVESRRNYMFLKQCVEASPIVPIQQEWLDAMLMRVPPQLRQRPGHQELLEELCKEVSDNFMKGMVQHTVNTVLQKPDMKGNQLERPGQLVEPKVLDFSSSWRDSFIKNRKEMKKNLHVLHPVMRITLDMCITTLSNLLLVDLSDCRSTGPVDCMTLKNKVALECEKVEDKLMNTWFPKVIHLLTSKDMVQGVKQDKLDSFYNCASTLISNQLKSLVGRSMHEFVSLFSPERAYQLPLFRMDLTFDDEKMEFYPSFQDLEDAVMEILNKITNTMQVP